MSDPKDHFKFGAVTMTDASAALTGNYFGILVLSDATTFTTLTLDPSIDDRSTAISGGQFNAGTYLAVPVNTIDLNSGSVMVGKMRKGKSLLWTPAALEPALVLWLDASDTSTITLSSLNNNTVSQVADKSSNGQNVSSLVASQQAIYDVDGLNNKPTLVFDGINDFMSGTNWWPTKIGSGAFSVFHVFESSSGDFGISVNAPDATGDIPRHYFMAEFMSYNTQGTLTLSGYDNSAVFQEWSHDGVQTLQMRRNGGVAVSATQAAIAPSQGFYAFPYKSGNAAQPGKSSEHVVVKGSISATDRQNLEGYLAHKWGLTAKLPANHPYRSLPPIL